MHEKTRKFDAVYEMNSISDSYNYMNYHNVGKSNKCVGKSDRLKHLFIFRNAPGLVWKWQVGPGDFSER